MEGVASQVAFWALAAVALAGAVVVALSRDLTRLVAGLGAFLLAVAGLFAYFGMPLLAVVQVFVYVGGVLVLVLFAIMLLRRTEEGRPDLGNRHDVASALVCLALFALLAVAGRGVLPKGGLEVGAARVGETAKVLLGGMLTQFEAAGVLLLVGLVAALVIVGGGDER